MQINTHNNRNGDVCDRTQYERDKEQNLALALERIALISKNLTRWS